MTSAGSSVNVEVNEELGHMLTALCHECGATVMRGVLAAWAELLMKHSGQEDVVVGIPYANRDYAATQDVVGYFVNTLAVQVRGGDKEKLCYRELVMQANESVSKAVMHAVVPFVRVVEEVSPERDASRTPVFQTMFVYEEAGGWGDLASG